MLPFTCTTGQRCSLTARRSPVRCPTFCVDCKWHLFTTLDHKIRALQLYWFCSWIGTKKTSQRCEYTLRFICVNDSANLLENTPEIPKGVSESLSPTQHSSIMVILPVFGTSGSVGRSREPNPTGKWNQHFYKACQQQEAWSALKCPCKQLHWLWTNTSRRHSIPNNHWLRKLYTQLQETLGPWVLNVI